MNHIEICGNESDEPLIADSEIMRATVMTLARRHHPICRE